LRITANNGASAYIEKSYGLEELQKGIDAVLRGEKHYSPGVRRLMATFRTH
jgi:DNA-binding NarL/FixJ family response regulator